MVKELYGENSIFHSLLVCDMPAKFIPLKLDAYADYYQAVTGVTVTQSDFETMAGRAETLIRMFNNREGFTRKDDSLPYRTLNEPLPDGPGKGQCVGRGESHRMLDDFYACQGWDKEGVPTEATMNKYDLAGPEIEK